LEKKKVLLNLIIKKKKKICKEITLEKCKVILKGPCKQNKCCIFSKKGKNIRVKSCKFEPLICPEVIVRKCSIVLQTKVYEKVKCCHYLERILPEGSKIIKELYCRTFEKM